MSSPRRHSILILCDVMLVWVSIMTSYYFRFQGDIPEEYSYQYLNYCIVSSVLCAGALYYFRLYNRIWQYASIGELISITKAIVVSCVVSYAAVYFIDGKPIPISIFFRNMETMLLLIGGVRFIWRIYRDNYKKNHRTQKALIIGAGECGMLIAKELKYNKNAKTSAYAFIDDDTRKHKQQLFGIPVVGDRSRIIEIVEQESIDAIIIALPSLSKRETSEIIDICKKTSAKLRIVPALQDILSGNVSLNTLRDVQFEDLLGRDPIKTDLVGISNYLSGKNIIITGAGGSIGSEICRQIATFNPKNLLLLGHGENSIYSIEIELRRKYPTLSIIPIIADVQDRERIDQVFDEYRPEIVFHAAAHKHVPLMEKNPAEAIKNNVFGTKNVADAANKFKAERFVLISSDKAVNPSSVMGTTKRIAEMYIQSLHMSSKTKFAAVRFGNVLGSRGSVIPLFKEQIARGGPVTVTHPEMVRYFMTIPEAVQLVIQTGALSNGGEIFVLDMGKPVRIVELAEDLIRLSGLVPYDDIEIEFTGIRNGEKLFEELLLIEEEVTSTQHDRIFIGQLSGVNSFKLELEIKRLEKNLSSEQQTIRKILEDVVPSAHRKIAYELITSP